MQHRRHRALGAWVQRAHLAACAAAAAATRNEQRTIAAAACAARRLGLALDVWSRRANDAM
eukprot:6213723-Prymnesium_polylepis.1